MPQPKFSLIEKDPQLRSLIQESDKKTLAIWALACAERVLPYFTQSFPKDPRPQQALDALQHWIDTGKFSMKVIRTAALAAHAAAREVGEDSPARSAARSAGQAVSTTHVKEHALAAANYALQAIFRANISNNPSEAVSAEKDRQLQLFDSLQKIERS
jgi:hypothetical protein